MKKNIVKTVLFSAVFAVCFAVVQIILMPKWQDEGWEHAKIVKGYYDEPDDSIDVLFLGSSQFMCGIIPTEIYKQTGITSYNLSTSEQELAISYYWLQEVCKNQNPQVVILETQMLFQETDELRYHQGIDYMKLSANKLALIQVLSDEGLLEDKLSYVFPLLNYHSRWSELETDDFVDTIWNEGNHYFTKGFSFQTLVIPFEYSGIEYSDTDTDLYEISAFKEKYLRLLIEYCQENHISIILAKTPRNDWTVDKHNAVAGIASEYGIDFLDYNMSDLYTEVQLDSTTDFRDGGHLNVDGAMKLTGHITQYLQEHFSLVDHRGDADYSGWETDVALYEAYLLNAAADTADEGTADE